MGGRCERVSIRSPASSLDMLVLVQRTIDAVSCRVVSHLIQYTLVTTIPLFVFSFPEANGDSDFFFLHHLQGTSAGWTVLGCLLAAEEFGRLASKTRSCNSILMLFQSLGISKHADAHSRKERWVWRSCPSTYSKGGVSCLLELHWQPLGENNERRFRISAPAAADIECNCAKRNNGHPSVVQRDLCCVSLVALSL
jgi:hypothetical protein